jgi:hypothetical protein
MSANSLKTWACSRTANGRNAISASPRRSVCFSMENGKKGLSRPIGLTPADRDQFRRLEDHIQSSALQASSPCPWNLGCPTSTADLDQSHLRTGFARSGWISHSQLVHELLLPRRLRRDHQQHVGMGRHPVFRISRAGGKGSSNLARRQRLDRPPTARTSRKLCRAPTEWCTKSRDGERGSAFWPETPNTRAEFIIFAAPTFLAPYLVEGMAPLHDFEYSPWLTANLTLEHFPDSTVLTLPGTTSSWSPRRSAT